MQRVDSAVKTRQWIAFLFYTFDILYSFGIENEGKIEWKKPWILTKKGKQVRETVTRMNCYNGFKERINKGQTTRKPLLPVHRSSISLWSYRGDRCSRHMIQFHSDRSETFQHHSKRDPQSKKLPTSLTTFFFISPPLIIFLWCVLTKRARR